MALTYRPPPMTGRPATSSMLERTTTTPQAPKLPMQAKGGPRRRIQSSVRPMGGKR